MASTMGQVEWWTWCLDLFVVLVRGEVSAANPFQNKALILICSCIHFLIVDVGVLRFFSRNLPFCLPRLPAPIRRINANQVSVVTFGL